MYMHRVVFLINAHLKSLCIIRSTFVQTLSTVVECHGGRHTLIQLPVVTIVATVYITSDKYTKQNKHDRPLPHPIQKFVGKSVNEI